MVATRAAKSSGSIMSGALLIAALMVHLFSALPVCARPVCWNKDGAIRAVGHPISAVTLALWSTGRSQCARETLTCDRVVSTREASMRRLNVILAAVVAVPGLLAGVVT